MNEVESPWAVTGWIVGVLSFLGLLIRQIGPWRKQISEAEERIRAALESALEKERESHAQDLERERLEKVAEARAFALERDELRDRVGLLETIQKHREKVRDAERAFERHRFKNLDTAFISLLMLLKRGVPVEDAVKDIEEMRSKQARAESEELAILRAAEIEFAVHEAEEEE